MTKLQNAKLELTKAMFEHAMLAPIDELEEFSRVIDNHTPEEIAADPSEFYYMVKRFWQIFE